MGTSFITGLIGFLGMRAFKKPMSMSLAVMFPDVTIPPLLQIFSKGHREYLFICLETVGLGAGQPPWVCHEAERRDPLEGSCAM